MGKLFQLKRGRRERMGRISPQTMTIEMTHFERKWARGIVDKLQRRRMNRWLIADLEALGYAPETLIRWAGTVR